MKIHDISIPISLETPVWPGDEALKLNRVAKMEEGALYNMTEIACGVHMGTHVDAPYHFLQEGSKIEKLDLNILVGEVQVIEIPFEDGLITSNVIRKAGIFPGMKRVLFKTSNQERWKLAPKFQEDYVGVSIDGAEALVKMGIKLVGIDYLSMAPFTDSVSPHKILLGAGIILLESLYLNEIKPGVYFLCSLPLTLSGAQGAPSRPS